MKTRFPFLDGVRGVAAVYVVLYHVVLLIKCQCGPLPAALNAVLLPFLFGRSAVSVFIVLSGFVLMVPVLKRDGGPFDLRSFALRRARRILPPYYAAVALGLAVCATPLTALPRAWGGHLLPAFEPGVLVSHLFLIHNLGLGWHLKINGSLWSLATEAQIYAVFALAFVPVWRRFGIGVAVALAWALGLGLVLTLPAVRAAAPLYLGLFSLGMLAAQIRLRPETLPKLAGAPWRAVAGALWFFFFCIVFSMESSGMNTQLSQCAEGWFLDAMVGLATMAAILAGCDGAPFLERPALQKLGAISFSLYLSHAPLLAVLGGATLKLGLEPWPTALAMIFGGVPLCLGFAALFWRFIEAPSQRWAANSAGSRSAPSTPERASTVRSARAGAGR